MARACCSRLYKCIRQVLPSSAVTHFFTKLRSGLKAKTRPIMTCTKDSMLAERSPDACMEQRMDCFSAQARVIEGWQGVILAHGCYLNQCHWLALLQGSTQTAACQPLIRC